MEPAPPIATGSAVPPAAREAAWRAFQAVKAADSRRLFEGLGVETAADFFEHCVDAHSDAVAVEAVDSPVRYTYRQLDRRACQVAHWALSRGLQQGDVVALFMENRPEYLAVTMGLAKVGITIALINVNLTSTLLAHAVAIAAAKHVLLTVALAEAWRTAAEPLAAKGVSAPVTWFDAVPPEALDGVNGAGVLPRPLLDELASFPTERPSRTLRSAIRRRSPLYYIYTSGTTGPSKAALFSHLRFIGCALTWTRPCGLVRGDRYYVTLPLYHGNAGCVAVAAAYFAGATVVLRRKFSASAFIPEIVQHKCTAVAYIGELWRYVHLQPPSPLDRQHCIKVIVGNGLRAGLWTEIVERFSIPLVVEHYGSTEMPGDAVLNYFNVPGSCGYVPPTVWAEREAKVVQFDTASEAVQRNAEGRCVECAPGEVGEIIFKLPEGKYDGYVGLEATMRKLYRDVFAPGDTWWSSGDLLRIDADGFFYFVDRTGDTFRWKGENVSTNDVCSVLERHPIVGEANVYGVVVPNTDGKAGMASLLLKPGAVADAASLASLFEFVGRELPPYAQPMFLRIRTRENNKTSTFKFQKYEYAKDGFDPARVAPDQLVFADYYGARTNGMPAYVALDAELYRAICDGAYRLR